MATLTLTAGGAGDLMTAEEYGPFELSLEWKISPNGNSGIIYLIKEDAAAENTYNTGPEMQVLDNDGHADGKIPSHRAGALYDLVTPPDGAVKPVGEWNLAVVRFTGSEIEHWLNGTLVSESSYGDDAWKAKVAASKFKQWPLFGTFASGPHRPAGPRRPRLVPQHQDQGLARARAAPRRAVSGQARVLQALALDHALDVGQRFRRRPGIGAGDRRVAHVADLGPALGRGVERAQRQRAHAARRTRPASRGPASPCP